MPYNRVGRGNVVSVLCLSEQGDSLVSVAIDGHGLRACFYAICELGTILGEVWVGVRDITKGSRGFNVRTSSLRLLRLDYRVRRVGVVRNCNIICGAGCTGFLKDKEGCWMVHGSFSVLHTEDGYPPHLALHGKFLKILVRSGNFHRF